MSQETRDFPIGDATSTIGLRGDGSMWISVQAKGGAHYQCDFVGSFERGPVCDNDFKYGPPSWIRSRLNTQSTLSLQEGQADE